VELYGLVRYAVQIEGLSRREAARRFGLDPRTLRRIGLPKAGVAVRQVHGEEADLALCAKEHGVANVRFEVAKAKEFPGSRYDLVTFFDCLHDMGDPAGAATHVRQALKPDDSWMIVEPLAQDHLEDNLNPVGRLYYTASTMVCVPTSLSQEVGAALGVQAGEAKLREVISKGGFTHINAPRKRRST